MRVHLIAVLLALSAAGQAPGRDTAAYQFEQNAKLAGRALACGDRAGHASLRSVSIELARLLQDARSRQQRMADFDAKAALQRRFSEDVNPAGSACRRNAEKLRDSLDRTMDITRPNQSVLRDPASP